MLAMVAEDNQLKKQQLQPIWGLGIYIQKSQETVWSHSGFPKRCFSQIQINYLPSTLNTYSSHKINICMTVSNAYNKHTWFKFDLKGLTEKDNFLASLQKKKKNAVTLK